MPSRSKKPFPRWPTSLSTPQEFPFAFLTAFGNKETTVKRLRGGVVQLVGRARRRAPDEQHPYRHLRPGTVGRDAQGALREPKTAALKARFVLATDGVTLEAEDLTTGETVACDYQDFPNHFGFFLALAGITTVKQLRDNAFDIRATSRLNRLYVELLKNNPDWGTSERRHDMNHFMARLIFCFFAEDTDIFFGDGMFTATIDQMSARDASNTHEVIGAIFRAMNTRTNERAAWDCPRWADAFPYVNGGLFSGTLDAPRFTRIARSYPIHIGGLDWKKINPDIFGSMIQAVAEDEERGALGMHYTSVPNILKALNSLFREGAEVRRGEFFILGGQKAHVVEVGDEYLTEQGRRNARMRVIFDNGTEIRGLLRSFLRALYKDEAGRWITTLSAGPLFDQSDAVEGDDTGTIYVLRSKSNDPQIAPHREVLHKIGVTGGDVAQRVASAATDATYLLADVEVVATHTLRNINRTKLEICCTAPFQQRGWTWKSGTASVIR